MLSLRTMICAGVVSLVLVGASSSITCATPQSIATPHSAVTVQASPPATAPTSSSTMPDSSTKHQTKAAPTPPVDMTRDYAVLILALFIVSVVVTRACREEESQRRSEWFIRSAIVALLPASVYTHICNNNIRPHPDITYASLTAQSQAMAALSAGLAAVMIMFFSLVWQRAKEMVEGLALSVVIFVVATWWLAVTAAIVFAVSVGYAPQNPKIAFQYELSACMAAVGIVLLTACINQIFAGFCTMIYHLRAGKDVEVRIHSVIRRIIAAYVTCLCLNGVPMLLAFAVMLMHNNANPETDLTALLPLMWTIFCWSVLPSGLYKLGEGWRWLLNKWSKRAAATETASSQEQSTSPLADGIPGEVHFAAAPVEAGIDKLQDEAAKAVKMSRVEIDQGRQLVTLGLILTIFASGSTLAFAFPKALFATPFLIFMACFLSGMHNAITIRYTWLMTEDASPTESGTNDPTTQKVSMAQVTQGSNA